MDRIAIELTDREYTQIEHARVYARDFSTGGDPGHTHFMLIAKLADHEETMSGSFQPGEPMFIRWQWGK